VHHVDHACQLLLEQLHDKEQVVRTRALGEKRLFGLLGALTRNAELGNSGVAAADRATTRRNRSTGRRHIPRVR
jgi:hypothetical protein